MYLMTRQPCFHFVLCSGEFHLVHSTQAFSGAGSSTRIEKLAYETPYDQYRYRHQNSYFSIKNRPSNARFASLNTLRTITATPLPHEIKSNQKNISALTVISVMQLQNMTRQPLKAAYLLEYKMH